MKIQSEKTGCTGNTKLQQGHVRHNYIYQNSCTLAKDDVSDIARKDPINVDGPVPL